jgi:DtxR family Mn-dependent transcriptional regulator
MTHKPDEKLRVSELSHQLEDYLEAISVLQEEDRVARSKDIAERLGVTRATVTSALRSLGEKGLINYQPYSHITLTKPGQALADEIRRRHHTLTEFLRDILHTPPVQAEENACRAEHVFDQDVMDRMVSFLKFLKKCPRTNEAWNQAFDRFCHEKKDPADCKECVGQCMAGLFTEQADQ